MIKEIKYNGITAVPSDYECPDGDLDGVLNLIPDDGSIRPILSPKTLLTLAGGKKVVHIHTTSTFKHYIVIQPSDNSLSWFNDGDKPDVNNTIQTTLLNTFGKNVDVYQVNAVGNTLIVQSSSGIYYYLWKDKSYISLGDHIPDVEISFGLVGHPRLFSISDESKSTFTISFDGIGLDDLHNEFSENNKIRITEQVMAKVNKFIAQETVNKGRFCFPFFVRYAIKLYDGSLVCHSAPVLMNPSTTNCPVVYWKRVKGKRSYTEAEMDIMLMAATLDYRIIRNSDSYSLDKWSDIIKGIDVYISKPIYTFDQQGKVVSFADTNDFDTKFIGRLYASNKDTLNSSPAEDKLLGPFVSKDFLNIYSEWDYSRIFEMYFSSDRSHPIETLHMPEFSDGKVKESIENTSTFYKLCSIQISEALSDNKRKDIVIDNEYLKSLVNREVMNDDYLSHDKMYANYSFTYNGRINLCGLKRKLFDGFLAQSMFAYVNSSYSWALSEDTLNITPNAFSSDGYSISVIIKENGKDYVVSSKTEYYDTYNLGLFNSEDYLTPDGTVHHSRKSWATYFFYPNVNAYKMIIYNYLKACYVIDLKPHEFLNGAFAKIDYELEREKNFTSLPNIEGEIGNSGNIINIPNKIYTSEVNNPFRFPVANINTVGTGRILGISTAAKALSEGQFGQFPLYAFTTEGVWAMEVSPTGSYSARQPITRDICINPKSITQIDSAVLFATNRGIMLISGSQSQCISDIIDSVDIFKPLSLQGSAEIIKQAGFEDKNVDYIPFRNFLANCSMLYDYTHQHIIVYNPSCTYAYVYSLKDKAWGMMVAAITDGVNSYPDALAMDTNGSLINYSEADEEIIKNGVNGVLFTRPLKLDGADIMKTIDTIIQRGYYKNTHVRQILYGSRDLFNWALVWSSKDNYLRGFRGTPYKYFRIALICKLEKDEAIYGCSVQHTPRLTNKPR